MAEKLTIRAVEAVPVSVEGLRDFRISEGRTRRHTSVILRLLTEDETVQGIAEAVCAPPGKPEELPDEIVTALRTIVAPALIGLAVTERNTACARVDAALKERPWTKAAVNVAVDVGGDHGRATRAELDSEGCTDPRRGPSDDSGASYERFH